MMFVMYDRRDWVASAMTVVVGVALLLVQGMQMMRQVEKKQTPIQIRMAVPETESVVPVPEVVPPPKLPPPKAEVKPVQQEVMPTNEQAPAQVPEQPVVQAPPPVSNASNEGAFLHDVRNRIERKKVYPTKAKALGMSGVVELVYVIDRSGRLISVEISKSSGFDLLDQAALRAVRDATFAAMPEDAWLGETQKEFKTKVVFSLTN